MTNSEVAADSVLYRRRYSRALWLLIMLVMVFNFFDVPWQYYFTRALGGYVVKIWVPPVAALTVLILLRASIGDLRWHDPGLRPGHLLLVLYFVSGLMSLVLNEGAYNVGKFGLIMFAPVTLYIIVLEVSTDQRRVVQALVILFVCGAAFAVWALYVERYYAAGGVRLPEIPSNIGMRGANLGDPFLGVGTGTFQFRYTLPGVEPTKFAAMLGLGVLVAAFLVNRSAVARLPALAATVPMLMAMMSTMGRSAFAALFAGMVVFGLCLRRNRVLAVAMFAGAVVFVLSSPALVERFLILLQVPQWLGRFEWAQNFAAQRGLFGWRDEPHLYAIEYSMAFVRSAPWFGVGITTMQANVPVEDHNRYTYMLSTAGWLTLLPYAAFIGWLLAKTALTMLRVKQAERPTDLGALLLAMSVMCAIKLTAENMEAYYYWAVFGLAAAWVRNETIVLSATAPARAPSRAPTATPVNRQPKPQLAS